MMIPTWKDVQDSIDRLKDRYGKQIMEGKMKPLEEQEQIPSDDPDLKVILAFRKNNVEHDREVDRYYRYHPDAVVKAHYRDVVHDLMIGHTLTYIADWIGMRDEVLYDYIRHNPDLNELYLVARPKRKNVATRVSQQVQEMLKQNYTRAYIAKFLNVSRSRVDYYAYRMRKEDENHVTRASIEA